MSPSRAKPKIKQWFAIISKLPYPTSILPIPSSSSSPESDATFCRLNSSTNSSKSYSSLDPIIWGAYLNKYVPFFEEITSLALSKATLTESIPYFFYVVVISQR